MSSAGGAKRIAVLAWIYCAVAEPADLTVVECVIDKFRSSYAPREQVFAMQFDMEARRVTTQYGTTAFKATRREVRAVARVWAGWQFNLNLDRNTGYFTALVDKVENGKYSYAESSGTCMLPDELKGARYSTRAGQLY